MNPVITKERLKIYQRYKGDVDGIARIGKIHEKEAFGLDLSKAWYAITSTLQDIELIKTGLVAQEYKFKTVNNLKEICDAGSFEELTKGLSL